MRRQQSGFTLVEIAIVLVIIGLLLGGILKGQELINSAKVKNLANDFRTIPTYVYAYQDKFKSLPGDDSAANTHVTGGVNGNGNGVIAGAWNATSATAESNLFWQHVRLANLAPGPTVIPATVSDSEEFTPKNAVGGRIGLSSASDALVQIDNLAANATNPMRGTYQICSNAVLGKFAKQLDIQVDDGNTGSGNLRVQALGAGVGSASTATTSVDDATTYLVCMTF